MDLATDRARQLIAALLDAAAHASPPDPTSLPTGPGIERLSTSARHALEALSVRQRAHLDHVTGLAERSLGLVRAAEDTDASTASRLQGGAPWT